MSGRITAELGAHSLKLQSPLHVDLKKKPKLRHCFNFPAKHVGSPSSLPPNSLIFVVEKQVQPLDILGHPDSHRVTIGKGY
eukprot:XP_001704316.1 Hypothetical protein GL50803_21767 [Giardia lamblia ATCC 50803]